MNFKIEIEREDDGRWLADGPDLPGVMTCGKSGTRGWHTFRRSLFAYSLTVSIMRKPPQTHSA
jgi:hypothetical protein